MPDAAERWIEPLLKGTSAEHREAAERLGAAGPNVVPRLLALLEEIGSLRIWDAIEAVGEAAAPAVLERYRRRGLGLTHGEARVLARSPLGWPALIEAFELDASRPNALRGIGLSGRPDAAPIVRAAFTDTDWGVRVEAAFAAGNLRDEDSVDGLIALAVDEDSEVRESAVWALARIGTAEALAHVLGALEDGDVGVRITAVTGLGDAGLIEAVPRLLELLKSADPGIGTGTEIEAILDVLAKFADRRAESTLVGMLDRPYSSWRADPKSLPYGDQAVRVLEILGTPTALAAAARWRASRPTPESDAEQGP